ncbi:MAG: hypothetical protein K0Q56_291 [Sporolactobacillus laevolacticus]|jgi:hypothetical protein|nr:hypothetical protein [Sporolactobacillus laevolacticus]
MICFHIKKLAVTIEWKSTAVNRVLEVKREQYQKSVHEAILDQQCSKGFYV